MIALGRLQCNRVAAKRAYQKKKNSMSFLEIENKNLIGAMGARKKTLQHLEQVVRVCACVHKDTAVANRDRKSRSSG